MKLLIADDNRSIRLTLRRLVQKWGYDAIEAEDGRKAYELLTGAEPPRIAILDWIMPGMDGVAICRRLLEETSARLIYTILFTSKNQTDDLVFAFENGACDFLSKPVEPNELRSRIAVGRRLVEAEDKLNKYAVHLEELVELRARQLVEIERLARTDVLTGVSNRRHFFEMGESELQRAKRHQRSLSILVMDLDRFKEINDNFGHAVGDEALKILATTASNCLRTNDVFGRLGGDEFVALLPETDGPRAIETAERLIEEIRNISIPVDGVSVGFTLSVGGATRCSQDESLETLLQRADEALYQAKGEGRNRVVVKS